MAARKARQYRPARPRVKVLRCAPMRRAALVVSLLAACGSSPPSDIDFGPVGSISAPSGKGSFRFGVATAATQIEDMDTNTDWYVWTNATPAGLGNDTFVGNAS